MIRRLQPSDRDVYQDLKFISFKYRDNHPFTEDSFNRSFVWDEAGRLVGFCKWIPSGFMRTYAEVGSLMVDNEFRGRGIAKALMAITVADALKHFDNIRVYDTSRFGQTSKICKGLGLIEKDTREWWYK